jgi:hypothetical protein
LSPKSMRYACSLRWRTLMKLIRRQPKKSLTSTLASWNSVLQPNQEQQVSMQDQLRGMLLQDNRKTKKMHLQGTQESCHRSAEWTSLLWVVLLMPLKLQVKHQQSCFLTLNLSVKKRNRKMIVTSNFLGLKLWHALFHRAGQPVKLQFKKLQNSFITLTPSVVMPCLVK